MHCYRVVHVDRFVSDLSLSNRISLLLFCWHLKMSTFLDCFFYIVSLWTFYLWFFFWFQFRFICFHTFYWSRPEKLIIEYFLILNYYVKKIYKGNELDSLIINKFLNNAKVYLCPDLSNMKFTELEMSIVQGSDNRFQHCFSSFNIRWLMTREMYFFLRSVLQPIWLNFINNKIFLKAFYIVPLVTTEVLQLFSFKM